MSEYLPPLSIPSRLEAAQRAPAPSPRAGTAVARAPRSVGNRARASLDHTALARPGCAVPTGNAARAAAHRAATSADPTSPLAEVRRTLLEEDAAAAPDRKIALGLDDLAAVRDSDARSEARWTRALADQDLRERGVSAASSDDPVATAARRELEQAGARLDGQGAEERRVGPARLPNIDESVGLALDMQVAPGLVVGVGVTASASLHPVCGVGFDLLLDPASWGTGFDGAVGIEAAGSGSLYVRGGVGLAKLADAGAKLQATATLSGFAGLQASLEVTDEGAEPGVRPEVKAVIEGGLKVEISVSGELVPYVRLGGVDMDWPIPLVNVPLATWGPRVAYVVQTGTPPAWEVSHLDDLDLHDLEHLMEGSPVGAWLHDADEEAGLELQRLTQEGLAGAISTGERAELFAAMRDDWVDREHQQQLLDLLRAEPTVDGRWALLDEAHRRQCGAAACSRRALADWAREALSRVWGSGLEAAFDTLMGLGPPPGGG